MPGQLGRYGPLLAALEALPKDQHSVLLLFADLEALLGGPLPPTAATPSYWTSSKVAQRNWERRGFTARLDRTGPAVVFTRLPSPS